jgi:hypothetical protein
MNTLLAVSYRSPPWRSVREALTIVSLVALMGCSENRNAAPSATGIELYSVMRPSGDSSFTREEQRIVTAARAHLEKVHQKPLDARYRVERTKDGYEVDAMFVAGYENEQPLYYPGGHGTVVFNADGNVVSYMPGE